jgi:predicted protein tyrosine phosphatase
LKVLFICLAGAIRSKRAAEIFADKHQTSFMGIGSYSFHEYTAQQAPDYVTISLQKKVKENDLIFVMEQYMKDRLEKLIGFTSDKIIVLGIEDKYRYGDPVLDELLIEKITPYLRVKRHGH